eukprot:5749254-Pleurochrysis_carterae.AAC.8
MTTHRSTSPSELGARGDACKRSTSSMRGAHDHARIGAVSSPRHSWMSASAVPANSSNPLEDSPGVLSPGSASVVSSARSVGKSASHGSDWGEARCSRSSAVTGAAASEETERAHREALAASESASAAPVSWPAQMRKLRTP